MGPRCKRERSAFGQVFHIMMLGGFMVEITLLPPPPLAGMDRKQIADVLHKIVSEKYMELKDKNQILENKINYLSLWSKTARWFEPTSESQAPSFLHSHIPVEHLSPRCSYFIQISPAFARLVRIGFVPQNGRSLSCGSRLFGSDAAGAGAAY